MIDENWFTEVAKGTIATSFKIKKLLHSEKSKWQQIEVLETEGVGKLLVLDGKTMVSDHDEFIYHESMVHVPSMVARKLKNVLVIGGGDGGIVRELTKYEEIESIDLCEIDERVVEVCKTFFPDCTRGLGDSRVEIHYRDGTEFIEGKKNHYDIIIIDSSDPDDIAGGLFTGEFYTSVFQSLTSEGIAVIQTASPLIDNYGIKQIYHRLRARFPIVESFLAPVLIYPGVLWSFAFASKKYHGTDINGQRVPFMERMQKDLLWYNMSWHKGAFALPNLHRKITGVIE
ncbi:MAG: polyamine aminopropyltransferase [Candidatus Odinarchaeota archaeon]